MNLRLHLLLAFQLFSVSAFAATRGMMTEARQARTNAVQAGGTWTNDWYVSTTGSLANSGTNVALPKPEEWAWTNAQVLPGHTVWFLPGTYELGTGTARTNRVSGTGTGGFVTFRNYTNGLARLNSADRQQLLINEAKWSRLWGFALTCSSPHGFTNTTANNEKPRAAGIADGGFTNEYVHCTFDGFGDNWSAFNSTGCVMYGCVVLNAGWEYINDSQPLGTGYGLYFHTPEQDAVYKVFEDNLFAPGMSHGVHSYSATVNLYKIKFFGNAVWCSGALSTNRNMVGNFRSGSGAGPPSQQGEFVINDNAFYHDITARGAGQAENLQFNYGLNNTNGYGLHLTNNVVLGGRHPIVASDWNTNVHFFSNIVGGYVTIMNLGVQRAGFALDRNFYSYDIAGNPLTFNMDTDALGTIGYTFTGWTNALLFDINSTATNTFDSYFLAYPTNVLVRPSRYEANRANIFIANNRTNHNVLVNVSGIFAPTTVVKVQNALNPRATTPHATLTVDGSGRISVPMTNLVNEVPFQTFSSSTGLPYNHAAVTTNGTVAGFIVTLPNVFF